MNKIQLLINLSLVAAMVIAVIINQDHTAHAQPAEVMPAPVDKVELTHNVLAELGFKDITFQPAGDYVWKLDNDITVYSSVPYASHIKGFAGETPLFMAVNAQNKIVGIAADENKETPEFWYMTLAGDLLNRWNGMTLKEIPSREVDVVTGATMSSKGVIATVKATVEGITSR